MGEGDLVFDRPTSTIHLNFAALLLRVIVFAEVVNTLLHVFDHIIHLGCAEGGERKLEGSRILRQGKAPAFLLHEGLDWVGWDRFVSETQDADFWLAHNFKPQFLKLSACFRQGCVRL